MAAIFDGKCLVANLAKRLNGDKYVAVGRLLYPERLKSWAKHVKEKNRSKNGRKYWYPDNLFFTLAFAETFFGISYRNCEGIASAFLGDDAPNHSTIQRRISQLEPDMERFGINPEAYDKDEEILVSADSTGIKLGERGELIRTKWQVRRGFIKLHILTENKTGKVVAFNVTDEKTGDAEHLPELLDMAVGTAHTFGRRIVLYADGGYDSRKNFECCAKMWVDSKIKVKTNSVTGKCPQCSRTVREQLGGDAGRRTISAIGIEERIANKKAWAKRVGYGYRWAVEGSFSSLKRRFGEAVRSRKWENVVQEIRLEIFLHNMLCV